MTRQLTHQKKCIIVIRDTHEFKIALSLIDSQTNCQFYIISEKKIASSFFLDKQIRCLEFPGRPPLYFYLHYWFTCQIHNLLNYKDSASKRQKFFLNFFRGPSYRINQEHFGQICLHRFINNKIVRRLILSLLTIAKFVTFFLKREYLKHFVETKECVEEIYFLRHCSVINEIVLAQFSSEKTKTTVFFRNIDAPYLKGPPVVFGDHYICQNEFTAKAILKFFGEISEDSLEVSAKYWICASDGKIRKSPEFRNILYATAGKNFSDNEPEQLLVVAKTIQKVFVDNYLLEIRYIHDDEELMYAECLKEMEKAEINYIVNRTNKEPEMSDQQVFALNVRTENFDLVLAMFSTIAMEAFVHGVASSLLWLSSEENKFYEREHLTYMIEELGIPLIKEEKVLTKTLEAFK